DWLGGECQPSAITPAEVESVKVSTDTTTRMMDAIVAEDLALGLVEGTLEGLSEGSVDGDCVGDWVVGDEVVGAWVVGDCVGDCVVGDEVVGVDGLWQPSLVPASTSSSTKVQAL
ncbi:hypothetical protein THAOC_19829, partial [Thalassiosira oceanica]